VVSRPGPRNTRLLVVGLVALSLAIITLDYRQGASGPLAAIGRGAQAFMAPMQEGVSKVTRPVGDFFSGLAHLPSLERENRDLQDQLATQQTQLAAGTQRDAQYQQLLALSGLRASVYPDAVPALVIGNGLSNFHYTITIDKGSDDGVRVCQPVIAGSVSSPRLVGQVVSVSSISSEVRLLIDRDFTVAGKLATSGATGLVQGQGEDDLKMLNVPPDTKFPEGDSPEYVFTVSYQIEGQHGRYPPGLLIGQVSSVHAASNALQTDVSVRPAVDFSALEFVLVLHTNASEGCA
jgi:rod shape-determining protein MreC